MSWKDDVDYALDTMKAMAEDPDYVSFADLADGYQPLPPCDECTAAGPNNLCSTHKDELFQSLSVLFGQPREN